MSKLQTYECEMKDKSLLMDAITRLGWSVSVGECVKYYDGHGPQCDLIINFNDATVNDHNEPLNKKYNIGVKLDALRQTVTGILHDNAMNGRAVKAQNEQDTCTQRIMGQLKQAYQLSAAKRVALRKGYTVREILHNDGRIEMQVQGRW